MPLTLAGVNNSLPVGALPPGKTKQKRNEPGAWYEGSIASNGGTHERTGHLHALQHVVLLPNDPEAHSKPTGGDLVPFLVSQGGLSPAFLRRETGCENLVLELADRWLDERGSAKQMAPTTRFRLGTTQPYSV